jgi:two-component system chemotaxis response regulator CheB
VQWLTKATGFPVHLATDGEVVLPGHAYVAPDRHHMGVDRRARIALSDAPPENGLRPSVDYLLRSARQVYGKGTAGVLLSGMGKDGAAELLALKKSGAPTFAQDRESSAVHGMPGEAIRLDAARYVLAPAEIAAALRGLAAVGVAKTGRERNQ